MNNDYDMLDGMGVQPEAAAILVTTRNEQRPEPGQHRTHLLLLYEPIFSIVFLVYFGLSFNDLLLQPLVY